MEKLKQMLDAYRNKEREFPSYGELMALVAEWEAEQAAAADKAV